MTTGGKVTFPILVATAYFGLEMVEQYKPARMQIVEIVAIERGQSVVLHCPKNGLQAEMMYHDGCTPSPRRR
jgi:hypothetical protein